jgi:hypothetical protein
MKANARHTASRIIAGVLVPAILSLSSAQAAEAVQWVDLPKKIGRGKTRLDSREDRQYRIVTKDGQTHGGGQLIFRSNDVSFTESGPSIPREQVKEIRIHRDRLISDALFAPASAVSQGSEAFFSNPVGIFLFIPVMLGVTAVAAPFVLPIEGVKRLLPDKVIKVAP